MPRGIQSECRIVQLRRSGPGAALDTSNLDTQPSDRPSVTLALALDEGIGHGRTSMAIIKRDGALPLDSGRGTRRW